MDNSLATYKRKVEVMIEELKKFTATLNHHVIIEPRNTIEDAVRYGFPEDIAAKYLYYFYAKNESDARDIIHSIEHKCIPYLNDVAFYIESAMNRGDSYGSGISNNSTSSSSSSSYNRMAENAIDKNNKDLEKALGIKQGEPMKIEEADKQNANPNYKAGHEYFIDNNGEYVRVLNEKGEPDFIDREEWIKRGNNPVLFDNEDKYKKNPNWPYHINCATCAAAYALRLRGFDINAKGNPEKDGNRNTWLSQCHSFDIWNNLDGTKASPIHYEEWMKRKHLVAMSPNDYKAFFEEECKDIGVYIVTVEWKGGGGHATILQRDTEGLHYIEPQVYSSKRSKDGRLSLDYLVNGMADVQSEEKGIMRVDNKLFNPQYVDLFNT